MAKKKMTPEEWAKAEREMCLRHYKESQDISDARLKVKWPELDELRPATDMDIYPGAVVYYPKRHNCERHWQVVETVDHPGDDFKAYTAGDGCRYGMQHAMVLK